MFDVMNSSLTDFGHVFEGGGNVVINTSRAKVIKEADDAIRYNYRTFVVSANYVKLAKELLQGTTIRVCAPFAYPGGDILKEVKKYEISALIAEGCDTIDGVVNHSFIKDGNWGAIEEELCYLVESAHKERKDIEVKFIVDCAYVTDEELIHTAKLIKASGADYIKTGTGWRNESGATRAQIKLIRETVGPDFGIKGTGPLTLTAQGVVALLNAGSNIIGTDPLYALAEYDEYRDKYINGKLFD